MKNICFNILIALLIGNRPEVKQKVKEAFASYFTKPKQVLQQPVMYKDVNVYCKDTNVADMRHTRKQIQNGIMF